MRTSITFTVAADGTARLISGPSVPVAEQRSNFNTLAGKVPEGIARVELWISDGGRKVLTAKEDRPVKTDEPKKRGRPAKPDA